MGTDFQSSLLPKKIDTFLLKVQLWGRGPKGEKLEKVIDSSILTSLGNIFCKKKFFDSRTIPSGHLTKCLKCKSRHENVEIIKLFL